MDRPEPQPTHRAHIIPWHIPAQPDDLSRDCILLATIVNGQLVAVSLHLAAPDA